MMRPIISASVIAVALFASSMSAAKPTAPSFPQALQGVWFPAGGAADCKQYLGIKPGADNDARISALVGSVVVSRKQVHAVAEYGEGNFYTLRSIAATGKSKWQAKTSLIFDSNEEGEAGVAVPVSFVLKGAKLTMIETHANEKKPSARTLVKCTPTLPKGY